MNGRSLLRTARELLRALPWLLPASEHKNALLRLQGHEVHDRARVQASLVWRVDHVVLAEGSRLGRGNVIKDLREVNLGFRASVGRFNVLSSHPVYKRLYSGGASLHLAEHAKVTSRHHLDCAGSIVIGPFASVAGSGTSLMTHSVDLRRDAQVAWPIVINDYCFVGTRCTLLGGSVLPARSVLAAGSVLNRSSGPGESGLWSGVPAAYRRPVDGAWFRRTEAHTRRVYVPTTDTIVENAF